MPCRRSCRPLRHVVAASVLAFAMSAVVAVPAGAAVTVPAGAAADVAWIRSAQRADGAIATYPDQTFVDPYLANYATLGLARAYSLTRDPAAAESAWRWLRWYAGHMDPNGFVTDYRVVAGALVSTGDMDSTDAYAATYLLALYETYRATGDRAQLGALAPSVGRAVGAILATQDADGLTRAKPSWPVKYLMDQAEAYGGLQAGALLAGALGDGPLARRASGAATRLRTGVGTLWNPATGAYDWAVHADGTRAAADWRRLYPDALQQAWAVAFGLVDPVRAGQLLDAFVRAHPRWAQPAATDLSADGYGPTGYWPVAGWALLRLGRTAAAAQAGASIRAGAGARPWPFSTATAGQLVVLDSSALPAAIGRR